MESRGERETRIGASKPPDLTQGVGKTAGGDEISEAAEIPVGLGRRFAVGKEILRDSIGVTYEAEDRLARRKVALKRILPFISREATRLDRLVRELSAARLLHHPAIVTIHDLIKEGDALLYTMEPLGPVGLLAHTRARGSPSLLEIAESLAPVCEALDYAHPGHVHGALCARSIAFSPEGAPKLLDFGIWKPPVDDAELDVARYAAPEIQQGLHPPGPRADVWGLGLTLFETLTGQLPSQSIRSITELRPDLPPSLDEVLRKSLCPADHRYESVREFSEALNACAQAWLFASEKRPHSRAPVRGTPQPIPTRTAPRPRKVGAKLIGMAAAALAGLLLVAAALVWGLKGAGPDAALAEGQEQNPAAGAPAESDPSDDTAWTPSPATGMQKADVYGFWHGPPFDLLFLREQQGELSGWYLLSGDPLVHFLGNGEATFLKSGEVRVTAPMEDPAAGPAKNISVIFTAGAEAQPGAIRTDSPRGAAEDAESAFTLRRAPYTYFHPAEMAVSDMTAQPTSQPSLALEFKAEAPALSFSLVMPVAQEGTYKIGALLTLNRKTACLLSLDGAPLATVHASAVYKERENQFEWFGTAPLVSGDHKVTFWVEDLNKEEASGPLGVTLHLLVLAPAG